MSADSDSDVIHSHMYVNTHMCILQNSATKMFDPLVFLHFIALEMTTSTPTMPIFLSILMLKSILANGSSKPATYTCLYLFRSIFDKYFLV